MAKMLRSKLFGYINDLDKDMEHSHILKQTDRLVPSGRYMTVLQVWSM